MRLIEERLKQQQDEINSLKEQSTTGPSQQHTAFDATGLSNNRKSSVASTEVPGDDNGDADDAPTMAPVGYPVDDITEMTLRATCQSCEHINEGGGRLCLTNWTHTNLPQSSGS